MSLRDIHLINIHALLEPPLGILDLDVVPTHLPLAHSAILRKRPILQPITALPLHTIVAILVLIPELHRDLVIGESEELFAQAIRLLLVPLPCEKVNDGFAAGEEAVAIAPDAVGCVCFGNSRGISVGTLC